MQGSPGQWRVVWLVASCACGRLEFALLGDAGTGEGADGSAGDADGTTACTWGPWQDPSIVGELDSGPPDTGDPTLRFDELEIVFYIQTGGPGTADLFHARRTSPGDPWGTPVALTAINTADREDGPSLSGDGLTLYWMSETGGAIRLWRATRTDTSLAFSSPELVPGGPFDEQGDPSISADGLELFHASTSGDLHVATRASTTDPFGTPMQLGSPLASADWQEGPHISADGLTLHYAEAPLLFSIRVATRPDRSSPFGASSVVTEVEAGQSWDPELSADGRTLYFSRFVSGERDIFVTRRVCL